MIAMNQHDPLLGHADYLARLHRMQSGGPADAEQDESAIDAIANAYDRLADSMDGDMQIIPALRAQIRAALDSGTNTADIYDALTRVGLTLPLARFTQLIKAPARKSTPKSLPADNDLSATDWANAFATFLRKASNLDRAIATACTILRDHGVALDTAALSAAWAALSSAPKHSSNAKPEPGRILQQLGERLLHMATIGCDTSDMRAYLARRHIQIPENDIAQWLARSLAKHDQQGAQRARVIRNFEHRFDDLDGKRITLVIDRAEGNPFRVSAMCATDDDAEFARRWLAAGVTAITQQTRG